eukprot:Filipodium_phascolosomae@DN5752_c0_g1_i1.p1
MAARNPGPKLQQVPMAFPSFHFNMVKDTSARKVFAENEVTQRLYRVVQSNIGIRGRTKLTHYCGRRRICNRDIHNGWAADMRGWTQMSRFGFMQAWWEGWLFKYGLNRFECK